MKHKSIQVLVKDKLYPKQLKAISSTPSSLYIKGKLNKNSFDKCISIVGTRHPTEYGKKITKKLVIHLGLNNYTFVSGFMYGIDNIVHDTCIEHNFKTIAVLPYGIDKKLNKTNNTRASKIIDNGGLLVSEYENDLSPQKYMFVKRNRIVSAISSSLVVIQGTKNSGTMTTVEFAFKQGKNIFAVPGNIDCDLSSGVNSLIKNNKAQLLDDFNTILKVENTNNIQSSLHINKEINNAITSNTNLITNNSSYNFDTVLHAKVYKLISKEPLSFESIFNNFNEPISTIISIVSDLEIKGLITNSGGVFNVS